MPGTRNDAMNVNMPSSLRRPVTEDAPATASVRVTLSNPILIRRQRLLSLVFNGLPLLGVCAALYIGFTQGFSTVDVSMFVLMYVLSFFGIEGAYHRFFAHRAFKTSTFGKLILAIMGATAAQGPVAFWVANHRRHHQYTDTELDTHSPWFDHRGALKGLQGLWHAHVGWSFGDQYVNVAAFASDMVRDKAVAFVTRYYLYWVLLGLAVPAAVCGGLAGTWQGALNGLVLAGLARIWCVQNGVYIVNSICHRFGSRPFVTQEKSTNNAWLALPTLGASWHNNHHAFPASATTQVEWWQLDITGQIIRLLGKAGLVWDIRTTSQKLRDSKKR